MMKATRSSPESQRSAFSDNSSVTECSRCEHFSPCSCCCRLVTERLDAGPSHNQSNNPNVQSQRPASSTTSPNPNVQPSEPTPATLTAADVSTSLRALAAVSTSDQSMIVVHPNTSTIAVTAATSRPISDPFGSEPSTGTTLKPSPPGIPNDFYDSAVPSTSVRASVAALSSPMDPNNFAQPSRSDLPIINQHRKLEYSFVAVGKRTFSLPPVASVDVSTVPTTESNSASSASKSQSEIRNPADSAEPNSIPNQQYEIKSQELITQSHPGQCDLVTKQQIQNTISLVSVVTNSLVQSVSVESSISQLAQPENQIPINSQISKCQEQAAQSVTYEPSQCDSVHNPSKFQLSQPSIPLSRNRDVKIACLGIKASASQLFGPSIEPEPPPNAPQIDHHSLLLYMSQLGGHKYDLRYFVLRLNELMSTRKLSVTRASSKSTSTMA